jgi:hypothetical protein
VPLTRHTADRVLRLAEHIDFPCIEASIVSNELRGKPCYPRYSRLIRSHSAQAGEAEEGTASDKEFIDQQHSPRPFTQRPKALGRAAELGEALSSAGDPAPCVQATSSASQVSRAQSQDHEESHSALPMAVEIVMMIAARLRTLRFSILFSVVG